MNDLDHIKKTGIIVVDMQADFTQLKKGALAVEGTDDAYLEKVRRITTALKNKGHKIFATQDFHPEDHISFHTSHPGRAPFDLVDLDGRQQVLWPPHCVQETSGAALLLEKNLLDEVIPKGMNRQFDSYSGFYDDGGADTGMEEILRTSGINSLIIYGLALDYCVKFTALDAFKQGFAVMVISDLCRGVAENTSTEACREMKAAGIVFQDSLSLG